MNRPLIILSLTLISSFSLPVCLSAQSEGAVFMAVPDSTEAVAPENGEEIPEQDPAQIALEEATEGYKNLKFIQYDGVTEGELYPKVMEVYSKTLAALEIPEMDDQSQTRLRGILLDINPLLIKGAIYYSSQGDQPHMAEMAKACVDTRMRPDMASYPFGSTGSQAYPSMVYVAASSSYNAKDFPSAIDYFEEYLKTGETDRREQVLMFLGQACINAKSPQRGTDRLLEGTNLYPTNYNLLMLTMQNLLDAGETVKISPLLERALVMKPNDEALLNLQAALYEEEGNFSGALDAYSRLYELHPNSLDVNRHLALCYYNLGVDYYNRALAESGDKEQKRALRQSRAYFQSAQDRLEAVVANDPNNTKFLKTLAMTYASLGETSRLESINTRLMAHGLQPVKVEAMPEAMAMSDTPARQSTASQTNAAVPSFQDFARKYVEASLKEWKQQNEFEKREDYEKRVNKETVYRKYTELCKQAENDYLRRYASRIRISDLSLAPYDVNNETYRIDSDMGPMVIHVPLKNNEAETFKAVWSSVRPKNPKYYIDNNRLAVASVEFVTPTGKTYLYTADKAANYDFTRVEINVDEIIDSENDKKGTGIQLANGNGQGNTVILHGKSDVDKNIPVTSRKNDKTIALIWANENYRKVAPVNYALNDGETFAQYCEKTLGIPSGQILLHKNLTYGDMLSSIGELKKIVGMLGEDTEVIFYYAGHGFPDEQSKDAYLLPVDGDGMTTTVSYPLKNLYADLADTRAENVMAFLDACFSGGGRDDSPLVEARGMKLKSRAVEPEGSMFVLTATSDQETAMPYKEKYHGLFTYWLLKKLQDSKGNATLKELSDFVGENVRKSSINVNHKPQNPSVTTSGKLSGDWSAKKLRP